MAFPGPLRANDKPFNHGANWGGTGLMEIPTARIIDDGVARIGYAEARPYKWFTGTMGIFPGLEFSFRLTEITNTSTNLSDEYGSNKDKAFDIKYQLLPESKYFPALAVGLHDFHGTRLFPAEYIVFNRQIYPFDFTLGIGTDRLQGLFGGVEWAITRQFHFMTEYNPIDYTKDGPRGKERKLAVPDGAHIPFNFGLRYQPIPGLDLGVTYQRGNKLGFTARLEMDVGKELAPKKPDPLFWGRYRADTKDHKQWIKTVKEEIENIGMQDVTVSVKAGTLTVYCQNTKYLSNQKAVRRIYRIMLFCSPETVKDLVVVLTRRDLPILTVAIQRNQFKRFVFGRIDEETFNQLVMVKPYEYKKEEKAVYKSLKKPAPDQASSSDFSPPPQPLPSPSQGSDSSKQPCSADPTTDPVTVSSDESFSFDWGVKPDLDLYLNDPSGFFKFRLGVAPHASIRLWQGGLFNARLYMPLYSDIESSNIPVPDAVRSDSWKYKGSHLQLERFVIDQVIKLPHQIYARVSTGYFEKMYAGIGGEMLKFIGNGNLAVGFQYDYAIKRKPKTAFELMDFTRHTLLGNIYYHFTDENIQLHAQYGRYLAKDIGWRFMVKRSYDNGVDIGCWYSFTDTDHLTEYNKGYHDKGVFIAIPVRVLSPVETRGKYSYAISPWTRDVAAAVNHRQSLYGLASDLMPGNFRSEANKNNK